MEQQCLIPQWIITCNPQFDVLQNHAVLLADHCIEAILPVDQLTAEHHQKSIKLHDHILMPGLINAHTHIGMSYLRGIAEDLDTHTWLSQHIWPLEQHFVSEDFVFDASRHAIAEMIKSGTTCFSDMYFYPEQTYHAVKTSGIRAHISPNVFNIITPWSSGVDDTLKKVEHYLTHCPEHSRITAGIAPHSIYALTLNELKKVIAFAKSHTLPIHIHLQETQKEMDDSLKHHQKTPTHLLESLGAFEQLTQVAHATCLQQEDLKILRSNAVHVVHCPESNMKLGCGICPTQELINVGINVALGTDSTASNNDLDLLAEMRSATLLAKVSQRNPQALAAKKLIQMATIQGAKALGLDQHLGSIEKGKRADLIAINLKELNTQPVYDPVSHLVYSASQHQVNYVWVEGKCLLAKRELTQLNENEIITQAKNWGNKISAFSQKIKG
jgi:5-methylthioadenosine/S-adenosylhomocysteine deaminase